MEDIYQFASLLNALKSSNDAELAERLLVELKSGFLQEAKEALKRILYPLSWVPVKHIEGPVSLSEHYSAKLGKQIYIFGDYHVMKASCPKDAVRIDDFTVRLVKYFEQDPNARTYDIMLETYPSTGQHVPNYMSSVEKKLNDCFKVTKEACPYKRTRFHYVDVRDLDPVGRYFQERLQLILDFMLLPSVTEDQHMLARQLYDQIVEHRVELRQRFGSAYAVR